MKKNNFNKLKVRGQVQLGESIAVIIIIIILLFVGIVFWNKNSTNDINKMEEQANELSVIEIANLVPELPEIKCNELSVNRVKCIDYYKLKALSEALNITQINNYKTFEYYNYYFKNSKITISQVYPENTAFNITLYDAKLSSSTKTLLISLPINIKNYVNKTTSYGFIIVESYYVN